jgi:WD40 repeat protein
MNLRNSVVFGLFAVCLMVILISFRSSSFRDPSVRQDDKGRILFTTYCGSCHVLPSPSSLTKEIWKDHVLPVMAARMGIIYPNYDPLSGLSEEEKKVVKDNNIIPKRPSLSNEEWSELVKYVLKAAPDSLKFDEKRLNRNHPLTQFVRKDVNLKQEGPSLITGVKFNPETKALWIGNYNNQVLSWKFNQGVTTTIKTEQPVVDFNFFKGSTYFTEIGKLYPTELSTGSYVQYDGSASLPLLRKLHRPVNSQIVDLNNDGVPEIVVCNFGNKTGSLSLYKKNTKGDYLEEVLMPLPGAIRCEVKDMNGDGKKDIVAMFSQGDESVYIFYGQGNLEFKAKRVLRFPPNFGTTDMVLVDYNHDGLMDILTVHGDNADYSNILKPYHGLRLNLSTGKGAYKEKFFYPVYGVTKVLAYDFDQDGDLDIVASSFFPDFVKLVDESFVYLENLNSEKFIFKSFVLKSEVPLKTLTLEMADVDGDGDMDVIGGNFAQSPGPVPKKFDEQWKGAAYGLNIFYNQFKK